MILQGYLQITTEDYPLLQTTEKAYQLGKVSCSEGAAVGVNWSFAPVVDLDQNYHNPITNVRTFGNDQQTVINMGKAYIKAAQEEALPHL